MKYNEWIRQAEPGLVPRPARRLDAGGCEAGRRRVVRQVGRLLLQPGREEDKKQAGADQVSHFSMLSRYLFLEGKGLRIAKIIFFFIF